MASCANCGCKAAKTPAWEYYAKNMINVLHVSNVLKAHKDFLVHVTLKNGEVYALSFRRDIETDTVHHLTLFQNTWVNDEWGYMPKMLHTQMYFNIRTNELEMYNKHTEEVPDNCLLVTYDMFSKLGWAGCFVYPPR